MLGHLILALTLTLHAGISCLGMTSSAPPPLISKTGGSPSSGRPERPHKPNPNPNPDPISQEMGQATANMPREPKYKEYEGYVAKPLERRTLHDTARTTASQGALDLWVDMLTPEVPSCSTRTPHS